MLCLVSDKGGAVRERHSTLPLDWTATHSTDSANDGLDVSIDRKLIMTNLAHS